MKKLTSRSSSSAGKYLYNKTKHIVLFFSLVLTPLFSYTQSSLIDPYRLNWVNYLSQNFPHTGGIPEYQNLSQELVYNSYLPGANPFNGEYMILLREHPFGNQVVGQPPFASVFSFTYKMEIVSFPFSMDCWNTPTACASSSLERKLTMPIEAYNNLLNGWGAGIDPSLYLYNKREDGQFIINLSSWQLGFMSGGDNHPEALVSTAFIRDINSTQSDWRYNLPHTVIKHTVYIHCNLSPYAAFDSIQWVYDNTRGRMRWYPFKSDNIDPGPHPTHYDVMYIPDITTRPQNDFGYNEIENSLWIDGGTIDYSGFDSGLPEVGNCPASSTNNYFPSDVQIDLFRQFTSSNTFTHYYGDIPPFSLLSSFLRNAYGELLAGYENNNDKLEIKDYYQGIKHEYFINRGFPDLVLTVIDPSVQTIYNPSEVTIDPDAGNAMGPNPPIEVIFPEGYTFKTILGRYPSRQQVIDANDDPQNGGPYNDLRDVPVPVDAATRPWTTTNLEDYPEVMWDDPSTTDPNGFLFDERFGYYYIENKATLTVEKCVKIFDARFKVNPGGTMRFNDYRGILGYEDSNNNLGRYKIRGEGGAILRNYANVQYVQNGEIFQLIPLNYIATGQIIAGNEVDPDTDQPDGEYKILAGADVTFTAGEYIQLTDGFSVEGGDFHAVIDDNTYIPVLCNQSSSQGSNRLSGVQPVNGNIRSPVSVIISPNPNSGDFIVRMEGDSHISRIEIYDVLGKKIYDQSEISSSTHSISLTEMNKGIMIAKVFGSSGEVKSVKVLVK